MIHSQRPGLISLRRIESWNRGIELVVDVYALTKHFPRDEMFGLTSQLRRAAVSIPSNIAEGNQRRTVADRRRFITDAQGSLAEVDTQLEISSLLGYISDDLFCATIDRTDHIGRMLTKMYQHMTSRP
jgi:four helix bundle protein